MGVQNLLHFKGVLLVLFNIPSISERFHVYCAALGFLSLHALQVAHMTPIGM